MKLKGNNTKVSISVKSGLQNCLWILVARRNY